MDGYAVRFAPGATRDRYRLRRGLAVAGRTVRALAVGEAVPIATGAPLPPGADAVARKERTRRDRGWLLVRGRLARGTDIHRKGEDLRAGAILLTAGAILDPYSAAILTAQGIGRIHVRTVRLALVPIGDELRAVPDRRRGEIADSISPLIGALAPSCAVTVGPPVPDRPTALARAIERAARTSDLVVTIGGTSVGEKDFTKATVSSLGELLFDGVRVNVLKRAAVGRVGRTPVVLLPGQVVAAVAAWHEHGLHVLSRRLGAPLVRWETVRLARPLSNPHPMDSVYLFRVVAGRAYPCRWGVRLYSELLRANAWGVVGRRASLRAGAPLRVQRLA